MDVIRQMLVVTFAISCILIPLESFTFRYYRKRCGGKEKSFQSRFSQIALTKSVYIFEALWLIHLVVFGGMAIANGWRHGGDTYMYYMRPGHRMIFMSVIGMEVVRWTAGGEDD